MTQSTFICGPGNTPGVEGVGVDTTGHWTRDRSGSHEELQVACDWTRRVYIYASHTVHWLMSLVVSTYLWLRTLSFYRGQFRLLCVIVVDSWVPCCLWLVYQLQIKFTLVWTVDKY